MEDSGWSDYVKSSGFKRQVAKYRSTVCKEENQPENYQPAEVRDPVLPLVEPTEGCSSRRQLEESSQSDAVSQNPEFVEGDSVDQTDYSPDDYSTDVEPLENFLQRWSLEYRISHSALKPLLLRLSLIDKTISTDPRRLLGTPRHEPDLIEIKNGQYWHHGLEQCLRIAYENLQASKQIAININIDGLPIFENGNDQVWPILFNVHGEAHLKPMVIGVFHGKTKPKYVEEFMGPFVTEFETISRGGIVINGNILRVTIRVFICDSPARSFLKGCVNFNAFHGCLKCTAVGERLPGTKVNSYPLALAPPRTDEGYRSKSYEGHHQVYKYRENGKTKQKFVETPLLQLSIDLVEDLIVADSLHLLHLGVMKKILTIYKEGNAHQQKWPHHVVEEINEILSNIQLPDEIHRPMRSLNYLGRWKGTELASLLNYVGIAILKPFLKKAHYENFLNLFCASTICSTEYYSRYVPVAKKLFEKYVENYSSFFEVITSNTHNLIHVADEVIRFGPLPGISSYPFENHLFQIKNMIRSGRLPLNQIINRIHEKELLVRQLESEEPIYPLLKIPYKNDSTKFSCIVIRDGFTLNSNKFADKWFRTRDSKVVAMNYVTSKHLILGRELSQTSDLFKSPLPSDYLNVQYSSTIDKFHPEQQYNIGNILCKLVAITVKTDTTFVPLIHTLPKK